jgi:hypothetical protein
MVSHAEQPLPDLGVGTTITEGAADFLVNRWMNEAQPIRWSRRGTDLLSHDGTLASGYGQTSAQLRIHTRKLRLPPTPQTRDGPTHSAAA